MIEFGFVFSLGGSFTSGLAMGVQLFTGAALGGTVSVLAGGSFANGAITGTFVVLFNHISHEVFPQVNNTIEEPASAEMLSKHITKQSFSYIC